jgi:hypothetical protein
MFIRKLINFLAPQQPKPQAAPLPKASTSPEADFNWPPSAEDVEAMTVVDLHAPEGSKRAPVPGFADVA